MKIAWNRTLRTARWRTNINLPCAFLSSEVNNILTCCPLALRSGKKLLNVFTRIIFLFPTKLVLRLFSRSREKSNKSSSLSIPSLASHTFFIAFSVSRRNTSRIETLKNVHLSHCFTLTAIKQKKRSRHSPEDYI